jgi:hypothetical protein
LFLSDLRPGGILQQVSLWLGQEDGATSPAMKMRKIEENRGHEKDIILYNNNTNDK